MCDTVVILGNATRDGVTLFGKNSDREPNEAHEIIRIPATNHKPGDKVKCTYMEIPQVERTYTVLLAKPFWMWGAEMGTNEHGLTIGNEAVFTKVPYEKGPALLGMDLLRLALERSKTADEGLHLIVSLLEEYGQGGNGGYLQNLFYHNSFLIVDSTNAWVLETAGRQWAAVKVKDIRSISNMITIGDHWDMASDDLVHYAVEKGWCKSHADFDFSRCYSDFIYTRFSYAYSRQCRTSDLLLAKKGDFTLRDVTNLLRDHGPDAGEDFSPAGSIMGVTVCSHAGWGPFRTSQSVGSMVSHLAPDIQTHFLTGTSAPCTSTFKPFWVDAELPDLGPAPGKDYESASLFWRHEALHRNTMRDYAMRIGQYKNERDSLENTFIEGAFDLQNANLAVRQNYSATCVDKAKKAENEWLERVQSSVVHKKNDLLYASAWGKFNKLVKLGTD